jgi:hypothetical protein
LVGLITGSGGVITEAGNHPGVAALVYITAFAPDTRESVSSLIADPPPGAPVPPILPPVDMIPPPARRAMSERAKATVTETPGSHAVYV